MSESIPLRPIPFWLKEIAMEIDAITGDGACAKIWREREGAFFGIIDPCTIDSPEMIGAFRDFLSDFAPVPIYELMESCIGSSIHSYATFLIHYARLHHPHHDDWEKCPAFLGTVRTAFITACYTWLGREQAEDVYHAQIRLDRYANLADECPVLHEEAVMANERTEREKEDEFMRVWGRVMSNPDNVTTLSRGIARRRGDARTEYLQWAQSEVYRRSQKGDLNVRLTDEPDKRNKRGVYRHQNGGIILVH